MQCNEYLRRKVQSMQKVIAAPTAVDSSTYMSGKRYEVTTGCCASKPTFPIVTPCQILPPEVSTASAEESYLGIKPAAYYSNACPVIPGPGPTRVRSTRYCVTPGNRNTLLANNVPIVLAPNEYARQKVCSPCAAPPSTGCDENGMGC